MDTEELIRKCKAISIGEDKEKIVNFEGSMRSKGRQVVVGCLVGKILHNRSVNQEGLKSALQMVWRTTKEVRIESLGNNVFLFKFVLEADKKRILAGGPWHFDRVLIILTKPKGIGEVTRQAFEDIDKPLHILHFGYNFGMFQSCVWKRTSLKYWGSKSGRWKK